MTRRTFEIDRETLESLYQEHTLKRIAEMYGVGETVVHKRVHEYGIKLKGYENSPRKRPKPFSESHKQAIKAAGLESRGKRTGEKAGNWKGGLTAINLEARRTGAYKQWKKQSLERVGYRCQECGIERHKMCECCGQKVQLHVHHLKSFAHHPESRFDPENSEVLCSKCHWSRHYGKTG
jgi:5-methylcytosine-specific restriction endonuclease McrA